MRSLPSMIHCRAAAPAASRESGAGGLVGLRSRRAIMLLATIVALLWQSVLATAHHHSGASFPVSVDRPTAQVGHGGGEPSPDQPGDCPLCQELAQTAHYLPVLPPAFAQPEPDEIWLPAIPILGSSTTQRSHAWQSRAPPMILQA